MNTSEKIVGFLLKHGPSSVPEIAQSLNLTRAAIRYHMNILVESKKATKIDQNEINQGRGRPLIKYELQENITTNNIIEIVNILTNYLLASKSLNQLSDEIWLHELKPLSTSMSPMSRINKILQFLNQLGVRAVWNAGKTGPQIQILHNPYEKENPQPFYSVMDSLIKKIVSYAVN